MNNSTFVSKIPALRAIADTINKVNYNDPILILCNKDFDKICDELHLEEGEKEDYLSRIHKNKEKIFNIEVFFNQYAKQSMIVERDKVFPLEKGKIYNEPIRI